MQHAFFLNQSQGHCWAEVTLIIFPLVGFHEKDVKMACLWKSAGRGCELIMSNLVKASLVWETVINKAWRRLHPLREEPHPAWLPSRDKKPALTPAGLNCVDCGAKTFYAHQPSSTHAGARAVKEGIVLVLRGRRHWITPLTELHQFFLWLGQPFRWVKGQWQNSKDTEISFLKSLKKTAEIVSRCSRLSP